MSKVKIEQELTINGIKYVPATQNATNTEGLKYVIVRAKNAGVFAGYLGEENGSDVILEDARRLWYWSGASSISELAVNGTSDPDNCKFPVAVPKIKIKQVIEIIECSEKARQSIQSVVIWTQHE
jgi:hypothetical protein